MYKYLKRVLDIIISIVIILILLPLFFIIIFLLKFSGEGVVFYLQKRVGFQNKEFKILKFATMLEKSASMEGGLITYKKDPRLLPLGGFLRTTKINELPQLVNIFLGQMSFVGPRPVMHESFLAYPEDIKNSIYNIIPGLTGIGSIIFRDEENLITNIKNAGGDTWDFYRNKIYPYKGVLEIWYQKNVSFKTDIKIIFLTAWYILFPKSNLVYNFFKDLPKRNF